MDSACSPSGGTSNRPSRGASPIVLLAGTWRGGQRSRLIRAASIHRQWTSVVSWKCRCPLSFQLARETRNSCERIRATLQSKLYLRGVHIALAHRPSASPVCLNCAEIQARTEDTLQLCTQRPWLTCHGLDLFLTGWRLGSEFRGRMGTQQSEQDTYPEPQARILGDRQQPRDCPKVVGQPGLPCRSNAKALMNAHEIARRDLGIGEKNSEMRRSRTPRRNWGGAWGCRGGMSNRGSLGSLLKRGAAFETILRDAGR
jgi:hypothetical protein